MFAYCPSLWRFARVANRRLEDLTFHTCQTDLLCTIVLAARDDLVPVIYWRILTRHYWLRNSYDPLLVADIATAHLSSVFWRVAMSHNDGLLVANFGR